MAALNLSTCTGLMWFSWSGSGGQAARDSRDQLVAGWPHTHMAIGEGGRKKNGKDKVDCVL